MRKISILLVFVGFAAGCLLIFSAHAAQAEFLSANNLSGNLSSPRSLYLQNCARCHGADGKSETELGINLGADDLTDSDVKKISDAKFARVIKNGRGEMPGSGKKLNAAQIAAIIRYVRAF